jgi:outer membrane biosynthesis protein TonB
MPSSPSQTINSARPRTRPRPTTARQPILGLPVSLLLHGLAVASLFFVFHSGFTPPQETHAVPVDLVTLAKDTNVAAAAPPPPPPQDEPVKQDLSPMEPPPVPQIQAEPAPDVPQPKIEIQEDKPKPPDTRQDISRLLDQLTKPEKPAKNAKVATQSAGLATAMTSSLANLFLSQIRNCWSPIAGAPNPADQIVRFDLRLNRNGSIASIETLTVSSNPYTAAAVAAATRAIYQCQPYHLPPEHYDQWQEINPLRFDPRQMMQQ